MPIYEFRCKKCNAEYDQLLRYDETGKYSDVICPQCQSPEKDNLISLPADPIFLQPEGTRKWIDGNNGHEYRYKSVGLPKAQKEREMAEKASHMGNTDEFYRQIDDISSGEHFGEIK